MRPNYLSAAVAVLTLSFLVGCYADGKWSMPKLTFSKPDAKPSPDAKDTQVASASSPQRPSTMTGTNSPAPGTGLVSNGATPAGTPGGISQYPYPSTQGPATPTTAGGYSASSGSYMTPQAGQYSMTPPATPTSGTYGPIATPPAAPAAPAYVASNPGGYTNPVRSPAPTPVPYSPSTPARTDPFAARAVETAPYSPPVTPGSYTPPAAPASYTPTMPPSYAPAAPNTPSTPGYGSPTTIPPAPGYAPASAARPADTRYPDPATAASTRPVGEGRGVPVSPASYTPGATPTSPASYTPGASGYRPGDNGYTPPGTVPYTTPGAPYTSPSGAPYGAPATAPAASSSDNGYRPGGTSDYAPRRTPETEARPAYTAVDANVRPAGYVGLR